LPGRAGSKGSGVRVPSAPPTLTSENTSLVRSSLACVDTFVVRAGLTSLHGPHHGATTGRQRGQIEQLPSGSLRVTVYAGVDPLTKRRHYLHEVIPPGRPPPRTRRRRCAGSQSRSTTNGTRGPAPPSSSCSTATSSCSRSNPAAGDVPQPDCLAHRPVDREAEGRRSARGRLRLVLRRATALSGALRSPPLCRTPNTAGTPVRRPVSRARLPPALALDRPADSRNP
jgi:hypothetical protein